MAQSLDYLQSLGISALGSRLRRLFENLNGAVSQLYRDELGFEQRWFSLTLLLEERGSISIQSAADLLGTSHVSILQIAKAMEAEGLLKRRKSDKDRRLVLLSLSTKGLKTAERVHEISHRVDAAAGALLDEAAPNFIENLTRLENALGHKSFSNRLEPSGSNTSSSQEKIDV
ncbi:MAG: MarR family transcriptional regulator [Pseudomonadota bacterium]